MELRKWVLLAIVLALFAPVHAARLPEIGGDNGLWGLYLNQFLNVSLDENGILRNWTVGRDQIMPGVVGTAALENRSVTSEKLADNAVASQQIADGSIYDVDISANTISTYHLKDQSVTAEKIAPATISSPLIADGGVAAVNIASDAITSAVIVDETILGNDISPTADIVVNTVQAQEYYVNAESLSNTCSFPGCEAVVNCGPHRFVISGFYSDTNASCATTPMACSGYCTVGNDACAVTATDGEAAVYVVCASMY